MKEQHVYEKKKIEHCRQHCKFFTCFTSVLRSKSWHAPPHNFITSRFSSAGLVSINVFRQTFDKQYFGLKLLLPSFSFSKLDFLTCVPFLAVLDFFFSFNIFRRTRSLTNNNSKPVAVITKKKSWDSHQRRP